MIRVEQELLRQPILYMSGAIIRSQSDYYRLLREVTTGEQWELKVRLADLAGQTGQRVDEFVEALLRRIADADVRFEHGVPVFPPRPGAPTLSVEDVDRLADGTGE